MKPLIAVVEDDPEMIALLELALGRAGFRVRGFSRPGRFVDSLARSRPHLCLIDVHLPGMDGRDLIRVLRANDATRRIPVIAMSAVATEANEAVRGLDDGADEYLRKPLDLELLIARMRGLLARARQSAPAAPAAPEVRWRGLAVRLDEHEVEADGRAVALTRLEFKLLLALLRQPERLLPRAWLLQHVWDSSPSVSTRTIDKHVESLRRKLPEFGARVETVVGLGYLFRP